MANYYHLSAGPRLDISFQRTLRIPDNGNDYPLPPGLGAFVIYRARDFPQAPPAWRNADELFISMYEREAMWIGFNGVKWHPDVVQIGLGKVNAISGLRWNPVLSDSPSNYLVCPPQPWLDGINAGTGRVRQFVAMPAGSAYTIEHQINGDDEAGGLRLAIFEAHAGKFPATEPVQTPEEMLSQAGMAMGVAAGGAMKQKIYPDPYGLDTWRPEPLAILRVHILNSAYFQAVTGLPAPPTPVNAKAYTDAGLPWFDLYDDDRPGIGLPEALKRVRSIAELDRRSDLDLLAVPEQQVWHLH